MAKTSLSDMLTKLSLDRDSEDHLSFYLSLLRRKGNLSFLFSQKACFLPDIETKKWLYLELRKIGNTFVWGCSVCQDLKTFRLIENAKEISDTYCIHAQALFIIVDGDDLENKFNDKEREIEVLSEDPYYAVAHVGKTPAVIHFPRQTKSANCSQHPGAHTKKGGKCEHLVAHMEKFNQERENNILIGGSSNTRAKAKAEEAVNEDMFKTKLKPKQTTSDSSNKKQSNPYNIKIPFPPGKSMQEKYKSMSNSKSPFPDKLVPDPEKELCPCLHKYCSQESAVERYLISSDEVHIHDLNPVDDSRNASCRVYYLDTAPEGSDTPLCDCRLPYTGENDHLLPVSKRGLNHVTGGRNTYHAVSYRLMFDFFLLEMSDGSSESGYINAFNRRRRLLCGDSAKECSKKIWLSAVEDFEKALTFDEEYAFSCSKCPTSESPGDGQDEVHIGDGVSEGTQVDLVPKHIRSEVEGDTRSDIEVKGIDHSERTIITNPKVRKVLYSMLSEFKKQPSSSTSMPKKPSSLSVEHVKTARKKIKSLITEDDQGESMILNFMEYISNLPEKTTPSCYLDILYEITKNTPIVGIFQSNSRLFLAALKSYLDKAVDIFDDKDILDHLNNEIPVVMSLIAAVKRYHGETFLPEPVKNLFNFLLKLLSKVQKLSLKRHVKADPFTGKELSTEYFPSLPLHSSARNYKVDKDGTKISESIDDDCNKDYPRAPKMTPGLAHIFCRHGICKGFVSMTTPETPAIFTKILTRRLPEEVQAKRRVFLYDNSCNLHKNALKRGASDILKFKIFTDRHHWKNHTGCSDSYNCDKYDYLKNVNSQICEQKNRSIRKLSSTLAYCGFENYNTKVKLFFALDNLEQKGVF